MIRSRRLLRLPVLALVVASLAPAGPAGAQATSPSRGVFGVQEINPLYRLFLTPRAAGADVVGAGRWRADLHTAYSNMLEVSESRRHQQLFDMERLATAVTFSYGVSDRWQLGAEVGMQRSSGGFLDPFIQRWHAFFFLPNGNRHRHMDNGYALRLVRDGQELLDVPHGSRMEDLRISVQGVLAGGAEADRTLAVRITGKLPTGSRQVGTGRADGSLELLGRRSWAATHVQGAVGFVTLNAPELLDPFVSRMALTTWVAVEREVGARTSLLAQVNGTSRYVGGFGVEELDHIPFNLTVGAVREMAGWRLQAGLTEDLVPSSPAVDFALYLRLGYRR